MSCVGVLVNTVPGRVFLGVSVGHVTRESKVFPVPGAHVRALHRRTLVLDGAGMSCVGVLVRTVVRTSKYRNTLYPRF